VIKDFLFENEWNKRYYKVKQVRPIFALYGLTPEEIAIVEGKGVE
jgi:hypothetical protein